jgi:hypothetical protein
MDTTISDNDLAVSKIMIAMREVNNDTAFIESMVGMLIATLSKKNKTNVKNFIVLEDGSFCLNAPEEDTIASIKAKIAEGEK